MKIDTKQDRKILEEAFEELRQARQNFEYAEKSFVEAATLQLLAAEEKVNAILKERRWNCENCSFCRHCKRI